jgi:hypothetical protein
MTGQGLVDIIKKFGFEDKVSIIFSDLGLFAKMANCKLGWMVGDNVNVNDVAICYVCKMLDLFMHRLEPKEVSDSEASV